VCILAREDGSLQDACFTSVKVADQPWCTGCEHDEHHDRRQVKDPAVRAKVEDAWLRVHGKGPVNRTGEEEG
jgi:hypothetical protein